MTVYKTGPTVNLPVRDGKPVCVHCGDVMAEVEPGIWQCAIFAEAERKLREALRRTFAVTPRE